MATAEPLLRSGQMPTQLKFRSKATSQRSFDEPSSTTPHEDPLRILVPAQKKLNTIESQRVLSVINETTRRLDIALVIPSLAESLERLSFSLGAELVSLLQEYADLAAAFEAAAETLDSLRQSHTRSDSDSSCSSVDSSSCPVTDHTTTDVSSPVEGLEMEEQFCNLQQRIRNCVKSVLRALATNPSVVQAVRQKKSPLHTQLLEMLRGLQSVSNEMLLTTKMEEMKRKEHMQLVARRRLAAQESIRRLEAELATAQKQKDEAVSEKKSQIYQLRTNIKTVAALAQDTIRKVHSEAEKHQSQAQTTHTNTKTKLEEEIGVLKKQLQETVAENKERELETRKKTFKRELEVENWIKKYDEEMGEKQDELEMLEEQFTEEKRQDKELDEKLGILKLKYDAAVKEQEEARLKAEQEEEEREKRTTAAIKIQKCWRAHHIRKIEAKQAQKGKKKGKGKGKGKKKT